MGQLWGPLPLNGGGSGGKAMGTIDLIEVYCRVCTYVDRISLEIGELLGEKV